ncbi:NAD(+) diphosphatase [Hoeflea sp. TYP-13]|uniref:NAD(+) diphosphatase n=1 Tax=Hoeflea sp. TYP-13 TaxID=3230023 RepID=UPI0034C67FC7
MTFFDASGDSNEPSSRVAFAGNRLDRRSEHRGDDCLAEALASPLARIFAFGDGRAFLRKADDGFDALHSLEELHHFQPDLENAVLLGFAEGEAPRIAAHVRLNPEELPESVKAIDHRSIYIQGLIKDDELGQMAQGASLIAWARSHHHCGRCGGETRSKAGGYRRECPTCGHMLFPRTDPVVIMLAVDNENDRCLLGRSPHFPPGMYSCLAGFLEPGETIEDAVRRETWEESGIRIGRVRYHASQPWPMPHTLMIGCYGEAVSTRISIDQREIEDCRWFSRAEAAQLLSRQTGAEDLSSPPPGAIAHHLIHGWLTHGG